MMDTISEKVKQWIAKGKDPRCAHWQGGLEAMLNVFMPYLEPGRLVPVHPLEEKDLAVFLAALAVVDLSPNLRAAFLPPAIAGHVVPPESAKELQRIATGKPSYKILIARTVKERNVKDPDSEDHRILCAEISEHADKPGVDIFQSGALLGTYNFESQEDCFAQLPKILKAHIWEKDKWCIDDHKRYTINWFGKVLDLHKADVCVEKDFSFFHSPTLIKSNKIDAIFILMDEMIQKCLGDSSDPLKKTVSVILALDDAEGKKVQLADLIDKVILRFLAVMKKCDLVKFEEFTDKETDQFSRESARTIQKIIKYIEKMQGKGQSF